MDKVNEISTEPKRIVKMLHNSRVERGASIPQLCKGVCSASMLEKIEKGSRNIKRNCLNRLLARLGVDQSKYEKNLGYKEYDEWKLKNDIINAIEDDKLKVAEELLEKYKIIWVKSKTIEEQFYLFMKAQILKHYDEFENEERIYELYLNAMNITVSHVEAKDKKRYLLSPDEINLVLECKSREIKSENVSEIFGMYLQFINYIDKCAYDLGSKAKIYPKVVVYAYRHVERYMKYADEESRKNIHMKMQIICEKAVDILRRKSRAFFIDELFSTYISVLSYLSTVTEDKDRLAKYNEAISMAEAKLNEYRNVCKQWGVTSRMRDCCYLYREEDVYCINDIIMKRRIMLDLNVVDLCEGICSEKTYRRIENREHTPQEPIIDALFQRLGLSNEYVNMGIVTDNKREIELYEKYRCSINANELDTAEKILEILDEKLTQCAINKQIILKSKSTVLWKKGKISAEEYINNLNAAISYTINTEKIDMRKDIMFLSWTEISNIHLKSAALKKICKFQEAYDSIALLTKYYGIVEDATIEDAYIGSYEMIMNLYASIIGSMGKYEESNMISNKMIKIFLKLRRTNLLHLCMYNIAWNNRENDIRLKNYSDEMEKCINLCQLTNGKYYEDCYRKQM